MADKSLLWIKKEVTYGVDPTAAAVDTVWAEGSPKFTPKGDRKGAEVAKPGVGAVPGFMTGVHGELTFSTPLAGSGTAGTAPNWGKLAKAAGYGETVVAVTSVTYAPAFNPTITDSVTIVWREGRRLHKLTGARGKMDIKLDENERPMLMFTFKGLKTVVTDGAILAAADATWTGWADVKPITSGNTTFTFAGAAPPFRSLSLDQSDNVLFADRPNQLVVELLGQRTWAAKCKMGVLLPSVLNLEALAAADTVSTLSLVHGATGGSIVTVNARFQNGQPTYSDDKGLDVADVDLTLNATALSTDNDLSIVLT